jgi:PAS domain S-box-containing protein
MPLPEFDLPEDLAPRTEAELRTLLAQLQASERRLRGIINADPFSLLIGDRHGGITYMNPPLRELLGYSLEEITAGNVTWTTLTPSEFAERDQQALQELQEFGRARLYEKEFLTRDGVRIPVLLGASMVPDGDGGQQVAVFLTDLTPLARVQHELEEQTYSAGISDERSRQLLRANPSGILIGQRDGSVGYINPPMLKLLGYSAEESESKTFSWRAITPREFLEADENALEQAYTIGSSSTYYKEFFRRDGTRLPVLIGVALIPNLEGGKDFAGFVTDLTELKRTERALEESRRQLEQQFAEIETLYRTAPIGLAFFDPREFRYLRLNDAQAEIIGKPKSEILGRTLTEIAPIEGLQEMFEQVAAGEPIVNQLLEGELPSRPGEKRAWRVNYFPVLSPGGRLQGIAAASLEVTHLQKTEAALQQNEKLAAVGRLASSISHEINNPLEAITNLLYLARHEKDEARRNHYLDTAEHEVGRVSQIATQTLRFHKQPGKPTLLVASDLIEPVLALYAGRLNNSGIHIERSYRSKSPFLCMEGDVRQVLNNLIGNAIDAMRSAGGRLKIRSADIFDGKTGRLAVRLTIADTGSGMSEETKRRIFEAFYTTKGIAGTGLGMWISQGIVEKHGGRLVLHSSQGEKHHGTVFQLYLPSSPTQEELEGHA